MNALPTNNRDSLHAEIDRLAEAIALRRRGGIPEDDFRTLRLQNGIYGMRGLTGVQMLRVRVPQGRLDSQQLAILAGVTRNFGKGAAHLTTRQDVQIYHVRLPQVPQALRFLAQVGLSARETSGNVVRNVTTCPLAGVCPHEPFDVAPYAAQLGDYFLRNPLTQRLPRKFKIALSGCTRDCAYAAVHDLGGLATIRQNGSTEPGFRLLVGGGLGSAPRPAQALEPFTAAADLLPTAAAIVHIFNRLGQRQNRNKARLKFLLADIGIEAFQQHVIEERRLVKATWPGALPAVSPAEDRPVAELDDGYAAGGPVFDRWRQLNVLEQKQRGFFAVCIRLPGGDLTPDQLVALSQLVTELPEQQIVITPNQNVVLRFIPATRLPELFARLDEAGLAATDAGHLADIVSCPGAATCVQAVTGSRDLAEVLARRLAELDEGASAGVADLRIQISGCPNACGQHWLGDVGLCGMARKVDGQLVPHYQLYVGGGAADGQATFGRSVLRLPASRVPEALLRVLRAYRARRSGEETVDEWLRREPADNGFWRETLADLAVLPTAEQDPSAYLDWGSAETFHVEIGESECA